MVDVSLFFSQFSPSKPVCSEKIIAGRSCCRSCRHGIESRFNYVPLLNHNHLHLFGFRSHIKTVSLTKNMAPRVEDTLPSGTCIPRVSPRGGRGRDVLARLGVHRRAYIILFFNRNVLDKRVVFTCESCSTPPNS